MPIADDFPAIRARLNDRIDPVAALAAQRSRLAAQCEAEIAGDDHADDDAIIDRFDERIGQLEEQIARLVATSAAGIIGQVDVLREIDRGDPPREGDIADRLRAAIAAGIERLAGRDGR